MMSSASNVTYRAPGKLFVSGEYAVLCGGWSLVIAVDRHVIARRHEIATTYRTAQEGLGNAIALPTAVLTAAEDRARGLTSEHFETDVSAFFEGPHKLGLGSSAASTAALSAALLDDGEPASSDEVFDVAARAHRALQGGKGSNADVAASVYGGVLGYRLLEPCGSFPNLHQAREAIPEARRVWEAELLSLTWPSDLRYAAVWTGRPASSTQLMAATEAALAASPDATRELLMRFACIGHESVKALHVSQVSFDWSGLIKQADTAYEELSQLTGAPMTTDAHRHLRTIAAAHGLATKPSGAGGGDFSLVIGPPDASWQPFFDALPPSLQMIDLPLCASGVTRG
jgi:phosphomevalonate kinase